VAVAKNEVAAEDRKDWFKRQSCPQAKSSMIAIVERLRRTAAQWSRAGVDLLFPPACLLCHADLATGPSTTDGRAMCGLCVACVRDLLADGPRCPACGEAGTGCRRCRAANSSAVKDWQEIVLLGSYGDRLRDAILAAKHPAGDALTGSLAELLVERDRSRLESWDIDGVVPVPMHWLRRSSSGTSAAERIAERVARLLSVPLVSALRRQRATPKQNTLPVADRWGNVRGAFGRRCDVVGRRLLLVDDVVTTGATLKACSRELADGGAAAVFVAAIAKADRLTEALP
jgi:ComF family protein